MYGLFAVLGSRLDPHRSWRVLKDWNSGPFSQSQVSIIDRPDAWVLVSRATGGPLPNVETSEDGHVTVVVDGYLTTDLLPGDAEPEKHLRRFATSVSRLGLVAALARLRLAAFAAVVLDDKRHEYHAVTDPMSLIPLWAAITHGRLAVSTRPFSLPEAGFAESEVDWTAIAEWMHFSTPFGARTPLKGIEFLEAGTCLTHEATTGLTRRYCSQATPLSAAYSDNQADLNDIHEAFATSIRRHHALGGSPASMLSAGYDSRFLLANWPDPAPPCYTYGGIKTAEVTLARRIAAVRGSSFNHVGVSEDQYIADFPAMFRAGGVGIFMTRFITARSIRHDGFNVVLDGLAGDVFLGGLFYTTRPGMTRLAKVASLFTRFTDSWIGRMSSEELAVWFYNHMKVERPIGLLCEPEFCRRIEQAEPDVLHHIARLVADLRSSSSAARLVRDFKLRNRTIRYSNQQALMTRAFTTIFFPFAADLDFARLAIALPPDQVVYNKTYVPLFRRFCPAFGAVETNHSLLPVNAPPLAHRLFESLTTNLRLREKHSQFRFGGRADYISTLQVCSPALVDFVSRELDAAGVAHPRRTAAALEHGSSLGTIHHLLAIARWIAGSSTAVVGPADRSWK